MHTTDPWLSRTAAFVMAGGVGERLRPLTDSVPKPLLPFGGVFRILDFTLSNCRNSELPFVGVLSQYRSEQVGRHLREIWPDRHDGPEFLHLPPVSGKRYRGTADAVRQNLELAVDRGARWVLVLSADHIYQADYRDLVRFHREAGADATVATIRVPVSDARQLGVLGVDHRGRVSSFREKPDIPPHLPESPNETLANMGVYVFGTDVLLDALEGENAMLDDFGRDVLPRLVGSRRVVAWQFEGLHGAGAYWRDLGTFEAYQTAHMDLLGGDPPLDLFASRWPITAADTFPAGGWNRSRSRLENAETESMAPAGTELEGATVESSVLSPGVTFGEGADVRQSVLMHGVTVGRDARVRRAVVESGVNIPSGEQIGYDARADRRRFHVTETGLVVVPAGSRFENGRLGPRPRRTARVRTLARIEPAAMSRPSPEIALRYSV